MDTIMIIDRLCGIVELQARIIREQTEFIENMRTIDEETKKHFTAMRDKVDAEFGAIGRKFSVRRNTKTKSDDGSLEGQNV